VHARVVRTEQLSPAMVRVVLGGGDLERFQMPEATDAYVNVAFRPSAASYAEIFEPRVVRETCAREEWPARRRYTVRRWDGAERELTLDFVVHADEGVASRWALNAAPGDTLVFEGPGSGYRPSSDAAWHLLVGDESALPAIAAALETLMPGERAVVRLVCDGPECELPLQTRAELDLVWLHRHGDERDEALLAAAVEAVDFGEGRPFCFVHGEADEIRAVRRHLLTERGLTRQDLSCSPYWRRTMTDEAWRQVKREYVAAMEAEAVAS
jgi:NADPH-dependent ferric siderophore reductase